MAVKLYAIDDLLAGFDPIDAAELIAILRIHVPAATEFVNRIAKGIDVRLLSGRFSR